MTCSNTAAAPARSTFRKRREDAESKVASLSHPSLFLLQRRLRDLDERQQRSEEMLAHACLLLQEVQESLRVLQGAEDEPAFGLPPGTERPRSPFPWWQRALYGFFAPWRLRHPHPEAIGRIPER